MRVGNTLSVLYADTTQTRYGNVENFKEHEYGIVFTWNGERIVIPKVDILHFNLEYGENRYSEVELEKIKQQHRSFEAHKYQMELDPVSDSSWTIIKKWWLNR